MKVRLESVCQESLPCAGESILARVVRAHLATRCEEHRPETDPCAELDRTSAEWECIEPEHGTIDLTLPRGTGEWTAIERRAIQIPGFERVRLFWWRQQAESRRDRARRIATPWRRRDAGRTRDGARKRYS
jgi:hypothetical protein